MTTTTSPKTGKDSKIRLSHSRSQSHDKPSEFGLETIIPPSHKRSYSDELEMNEIPNEGEEENRSLNSFFLEQRSHWNAILSQLRKGSKVIYPVEAAKLIERPSVMVFAKGFGKFLETGFLSDLLLIHLKQEYHVHQVRLIRKNRYWLNHSWIGRRCWCIRQATFGLRCRAAC